MTPNKKVLIMGDEALFMQALGAFNNSLANAGNMVLAYNKDKVDKDFSREMSDLSWQRNIRAWNVQNEYNRPINQYARQLEGLLANGLNPNLVYGSSSTVTGAAGSVSPYKMESWHGVVPQMRGVNPVDQILSTRLLQTQVAAQEASNRLVNARADNEEARLPGVAAKSNEAAYRWQTIQDNLLGNLDEAIQASIAKEYWTGIKAEYDAGVAHYKRDMAFYEAAMAEWLNTTEIEGLGMTYQQYMEQCKVYLPGIQYEKFKAEILNIASQIAYRKEQGQLLDLKQEYQTYLNRLAKYGRSLGNDWVTLLLAGLQELWPKFKGVDLSGGHVQEKPKDAYERGMAEHPAHNY